MAASKETKKTYSAIAKDLVRRINAGELAEGSFLPVERELMEHYGVTRTTIRRALASLVEEGHGTSIPNKGVLPLVKGLPRSRNIAFVDGSTVVLRKLYSKLNAEFLEVGYHLIHLDSQVIGLENALSFALERGFDAAFVWSFEGYPDVSFLENAESKMSIVTLDHYIRGFDSDLVTFDFFQMAVEAVGYLIKRGRKRVAVTGMLDMLNTTHDRFSGYLKALFDNDQTPDVRDFAFCYTSGYREPSYDQLAHRLTGADRPDAIFVLQDEMVPGVVDTVLGCGLSVPGDIEIATLGDDVVVSVGGQGITAVHCDWDGFAQLALTRMLERLKNPSEPHKRILGTHALVPPMSRETSQKQMWQDARTLVVTRHRKEGQTGQGQDSRFLSANLSQSRGNK